MFPPDDKISKPLLRVALSVVFLYFGFKQMLNPDAWVDFVPSFLTSSAVTANNLVIFNSIVELTLGTFMLIGLYTRLSSIILSLHLFFIGLSIGFVPTGIRDLGLAFATLAVFFNGTDKYCVDEKYFSESKKDNINKVHNKTSN